MSKNYLKIKNSFPALPTPDFEPLTELISNREATIEGCEGIIEYKDTFVSVNCRNFTVNFSGFNFRIRSNSKDSITVSGCITDIKFITD